MSSTLNAVSLRHHLTYNWWKYLLVLVFGIMGVDLYYSITAPRVSAEKRVEMIVCGVAFESDFQDYMERIRAAEMPDIQETELTVITDDYTSVQYLSTRIGVQEGDLYLVTRDQFLNYASLGVFEPLEKDEALKPLLSDLTLKRGWYTDEDTREAHLYGIPLDQLPGLEKCFFADNGFLCVTRFSKSKENAMVFLRALVRDMKPGAVPSSAAE